MTLTLSIPGFGELDITHVLFDLNGTLALDGIIADSTRERLRALGHDLTLVVMTADTFGTLDQVIADLPIQAQRVQQRLGADEKRQFLQTLGPTHTIAVGNGRNDTAMLQAAALGIAILGPEGAAKEALLAADLVYRHIDEALDSLIYPKRLIASLRG